MTAEERKERRKARLRFYGPRPESDDVVRACVDLLLHIGEVNGARSAATSYLNNAISGIEEAMHEMAHHVALEGNVDFSKRRKQRITPVIDKLPAAQRAGTEMDTLAIELEALWWLYLPVPQMRLVHFAREAVSWELPCLSPRTINRVVSELRRNDAISELGRILAEVVYEQIEVNKRYPNRRRR